MRYASGLGRSAAANRARRQMRAAELPAGQPASDPPAEQHT